MSDLLPSGYAGYVVLVQRNGAWRVADGGVYSTEMTARYIAIDNRADDPSHEYVVCGLRVLRTKEDDWDEVMEWLS